MGRLLSFDLEESPEDVFYTRQEASFFCVKNDPVDIVDALKEVKSIER